MVVVVVSQKIDEYLNEIAKQNNRTARVFACHLRDFDRFNGGGRTDEVILDIKSGKVDVYDLLKSYAGFLLNKGTLSAKTIRYSVKTARRFLEFYDVDISTRKFHIKVKLPKAIKTRPAALSKSDVVKIINALPDLRIKTYVMFLASTGCRAEEALSITMGDLELAKNPPTVHIDGNFTKTREDRDIWLTEELKRQLEVWIEYKYRPRTIKSRDDGSNGKKWIKRDIEPVQSPADFVFLPYGNKKPDNLHKLKNLLQAQRILKNSYYPLYDAFKAAIIRIGYPKITFHSFRRFVYTTIDGLGNNQFAEFYLGHTSSEYWAKPEAEKVRVFKQIQPYLTYTDMVQLEARGAVVENRLQESDERYLKLMQDHERQRQENALLAACVLAQSESEKQEAAARLREFYGIIQSTTDGRPYATRNLEVLDKFGGVNIHSRPKIISRRGSTEDGNKTGIHALGVFTVPEETGEEQEYYFIEGVPEGVERVELRNSKKKKRKNRGDKAAADADDDFD